MRDFNFLLEVNSRLSERVYAMFSIIDLVVVLMVPLEQILNFEPLTADGKITKKYNLFLNGLAQVEEFQIITDIVNGFLLLFLVLMFVCFVRVKELKDQVSALKHMRYRHLELMALFLLVIGRFISFYFLGIQIVAIRCYFSHEVCKADTGTVRLATNIIGCAFTMLIMILQFKYQRQNLPIPTQPWAARRSGYHLTHRLLLLVSLAILVFEDLIIAQIDYFIIFLPLLLISSILLWLILFNTIFYSVLVDQLRLAVCIIVWNFSLFAFLIEIISGVSDFAFAVFLGITTTLMTLAALLFKRQKMYNKIEVREIKNEGDAIQAIYRLYQLILKSKDQNANLTIDFLYRAHKLACEKPDCICKAKLNEKKEDDQQLSKRQKHQRMEKEQHDKKYQRNIMVLQIFFDALDHQFESKMIRFFQQYIYIVHYKKVYSSLYTLLEMKKTFTDREMHNFCILKSLILNEVSESLTKTGKESFNVDQMINLDNKFTQYKKLVNDTAVLVERFWTQLQKQDYVIQHLIKVGNEIVESYLKTKQTFEFIITQKPDLEEIVSIHIKFNESVMNFEIEAQVFQTMLTNIRQKLQISKQSHYLESKDSQAVLLVSANPSTLNRILLVNQKTCSLLGYQSAEIQGKSMHLLMPSIVAQVHDKMLISYLTESTTAQLQEPRPKRVWLMKKDHSIHPCTLSVSVRVSQSQDLILLAQVKDDQEHKAKNFTISSKEAFTIITDDQGVIQDASSNVIERFVSDDFFSFDDTRILIMDIIENLATFNEEDFLGGVKTSLLNQCIGNYKHTVTDFSQSVPIHLIRKVYNLPNKATIYEYIFQPLFTSDYDVHQSPYKLASQDQVDLRNSIQAEDLNGIQLQENGGSQSGSGSGSISGSGSMSGSRSSVISLTMRLKQQLDEKEVPQSLRNLKKAIILFFLILMATSFTVLGVNQLQNDNFNQDSRLVRSAISMSSNLGYMRLAFRMMVTVSKIVDESGTRMKIGSLQSRLNQYLQALQNDVNTVIDQSNFQENELRSTVMDELVEIWELDQYSVVTKKNFTLSFVLQQYISKGQPFGVMDETSFTKEFEIFRLRALPPQPTINHRDAYYLMMNGMYDIRDYSLRMSDLYIEQSINKIHSYSQIVLIITMSCIFITLLSALIMIPITFALDNEFSKIVEQWMLISKKEVAKILKGIHNFQTIRHQEEKKVQKAQKKLSDNIILRTINDTNSDYIGTHNSFMAKSFKFDGIEDFNVYDQSQLELVQNKRHIKFADMPNMNSNNVYMQAIMESSILYPGSPVKGSLNSVKSKVDSVASKRSQNLRQNPISDISQVAELPQPDDDYQPDENQVKKLVTLFRWKKLLNALLIIGFSVIIFAFYIAFFVLSDTQFNAAEESFRYIRTFSRRPLCLANSFNYMIDTYAQNKTITIGFNDVIWFTYMQSNCMAFETELRLITTDKPPQLDDFQNLLRDINSHRLCEIVFEGNQTHINSCLGYNNGILQQGLRNTMMKLYYYITGEYVAFTALDKTPWLRTNQFLSQREFQSSTQLSITLLFEYILPASEHLLTSVIRSVSDYQDSLVQIYISIFVIFMIFLIVTLIVTLKLIINYLKTMVIRSRLLVKIIPSDALIKVTRALRKKEKQKKSKKQEFRIQQVK